jgi:hypothetical protein
VILHGRDDRSTIPAQSLFPQTGLFQRLDDVSAIRTFFQPHIREKQLIAKLQPLELILDLLAAEDSDQLILAYTGLGNWTTDVSPDVVKMLLKRRGMIKKMRKVRRLGKGEAKGRRRETTGARGKLVGRRKWSLSGGKMHRDDPPPCPP